MIDTCDIAIVGGGAAGLAAAIFAAERLRERGEPARRIVILDGAARLGAKILVSGGGRCNVTHDRVTADDFNGPRNIVRNVLRAFDERATVRWFESLGVALKREETGKLFPVSDNARTVLNALLNRCAECGVEIQCGCPVRRVRRCEDESATPGENLFAIDHTTGVTHTRCVIMATGGRSLPKTGSDGSGWHIVQSLGHTVTPTYPALAPLILDTSMFHATITGVSHDATLTTEVDGKRVDRRTGSLLWTHFGISGPVVMDTSRHWIFAHAEARSPVIRCSLVPDAEFDVIDHWLIDVAAAAPRKRWATVLAERMPQRLATALVAHANMDPDQPIGQTPRDVRRNLTHLIVGVPLPVVRDRGWNYAEVTAGGVPMSEVDHRTMASKLVSGLYLVGEMLDVDGRIGGFNFQWAWSTGNAAGRAAADACVRPTAGKHEPQ